MRRVETCLPPDVTAASPVSNEGIFGATTAEEFFRASVVVVTPSVVVVIFFMVVVGAIVVKVALGETELTVGIAICPTGARVVLT